MKRSLLCFLAFTAAGCSAHVGSTAAIPDNANGTCEEQCAEVGMHLGAMVVMANNVGCVCEPGDSGKTSRAAALGGMATIAILEEQQRQAAQAAAAGAAVH